MIFSGVYSSLSNFVTRNDYFFICFGMKKTTTERMEVLQTKAQLHSIEYRVFIDNAKCRYLTLS